jgi:DNA polymerase-3 subunit gamma/tau
LVLARKFRPKFLKDIIGQETLVQSLTHGILEQRLPQAVLLHGIRGTGKTSTARILARSLNCTGTDGLGDMTISPCGVCKSCKAIDDDSHVDVIEIDAASHTGVDDVREIIDSVRYKAVIGRYKIFIIDEVHMLSKSAFNALLKTLEEPPSHVLFIFATTEINKIPATILSRCARFDLKRVDSKTLIEHIRFVSQSEGYDIENDACALLVRSADGSVRDSLTLLDQAMNLTQSGEFGEKKIIKASIIRSMIGFGDRQKIFGILSNIIDKNVENVIEDVRLLLNNGADPFMIMQDLLESLYHTACFKMLPNLSKDESIPEFERELALGISQKSTGMQLLSLWKVLIKSYLDVKNAPFADQAVEIGLIRTCFAAQLPSIEQLLNESQNSDVDKRADVGPTKVILQENNESLPVSSLPTYHSVSSVQELLSALESNREALLLSYVKKDIAFVDFKPCNVQVSIKTEEAVKSLPLLKNFLNKYTGVFWNIEIDKSATTVKTEHEKSQRDRDNKDAEILRTPVIQDIQQIFPGSKIEFVE